MKIRWTVFGLSLVACAMTWWLWVYFPRIQYSEPKTECGTIVATALEASNLKTEVIYMPTLDANGHPLLQPHVYLTGHGTRWTTRFLCEHGTTFDVSDEPTYLICVGHDGETVTITYREKWRVYHDGEREFVDFDFVGACLEE